MDQIVNQWAEALIGQLVKSGVRQFFIAPGSRSTPLVAAASEHPLAETFVHFDERGLGFYALGFAKARKLPVALIVTSGSALGHLFPAIMEAHASRIPLILLTADRPFEMLDCGENQTCDQLRFFGEYVHWFYTLPPIEEGASAHLATSVAAHAARIAMAPETGPVHINCMFREPFFKQGTADLELPYKTHFMGKNLLEEGDIEAIALKLSQFQNGILLAGSYTNDKISEHLSSLSRRLNWPIFSSVTSPYRTGKTGNNHVQFSDLLIHRYPIESVECIFQIGDRFLSKGLLTALQTSNIKEWMLLSETTARRDQGLSITTQICADPENTLKRLLPITYSDTSQDWTYSWTQFNAPTARMLAGHFREDTSLSEYHIFFETAQKAENKSSFFFGNSLTIRNADAFFYPNCETTIYSSRGVSGIDGHVATAAGIAAAQKRPLIAVMGDQTFLHDCNSLPLLQQTTVPVLLLVVNNGGGKIFSFLPIEENTALHTQYFYNPHSYPLIDLGISFGIETMQINNFQDFSAILDSFLAAPRSLLVELVINTKCITEERKTIHAMLQKTVYQST